MNVVGICALLLEPTDAFPRGPTNKDYFYFYSVCPCTLYKKQFCHALRRSIKGKEDFSLLMMCSCLELNMIPYFIGRGERNRNGERENKGERKEKKDERGKLCKSCLFHFEGLD